MIFLNETDDDARQLAIHLAELASPLIGITAHGWSPGEVQIRVPGGVYVNADVTRIIEIGNGDYALKLTDAQVATKGKIYIYANVSGAQPWSSDDDIIDTSQIGTGGPGGTLPAGPITLADIESTVRQRGEYLNSVTFTPAYVQGEIQAAWSELYELIANVYEGWWDTDTTITTVANQSYVALPTDCWRVAGIDLQFNGVWQELRQIGIGDRNRYQVAGSQPIAYRLSARGAELYPPPASITYTLRVTYTPMRGLLGADGVQFYNDWQEYVVVGALLRLDQREGISVAERMAELGRVRERIVEAASKRRSQEPEYLQLREPHFFGEHWGDF